jgi:hypothetical protein
MHAAVEKVLDVEDVVEARQAASSARSSSSHVYSFPFCTFLIKRRYFLRTFSFLRQIIECERGEGFFYCNRGDLSNFFF